MSSPRQLTRSDMEVLEFARATWKYLGARDAAVLTRFGCTTARYLQRLHWLLEQPAAALYDPQLVARERRLIDQHRQARQARATGFTVTR